MSLVPHQYQEEAVDSVHRYFEENTGNPLIQMPTGTGKSVVIARFIQKMLARYPRTKIIIPTHVKELVKQNYQKMMTIWPTAPAGINSAGLRQRDTAMPITFAGIKSVAGYAAEFGHIDLAWVDECHLVGEKDEGMYRSFFTDLKAINPHLKIIGSSATPWRMGLGHLTQGSIFTDTCFDTINVEAFNRFITEGYLCPLMPRPTETYLDVSGVHMRGGEYKSDELIAAIDRDEITQRACEEAADIGRDRKHWLTFCAGVEHAQHTADILNSMGIRSIAIYDKMPNRDEAIAGWKAGYYRCATNNNILTTGIDFPALDLIMVLTATMSPIKWVQLLGRGTRCLYAPGFNINEYAQRMEAIYLGGKTNCLVLDYGRTSERLGPINDPVLPRKKGEKPGDAPIRICDECGMYNHAAARFCGGISKNDPAFTGASGCGYEFPRITKLVQGASTVTLIKDIELPVVHIFKIDRITYSEHRKGAYPSMRVTYYCGIREFSEFICLEHQSYASKVARMWWRQHSDTTPPDTIAAAIAVSDSLKVATHLRVWLNAKDYPKIMDYCFDGTEFGTVAVGETYEQPVIEVKSPIKRDWVESDGPRTADDFDDDIPF